MKRPGRWIASVILATATAVFAVFDSLSVDSFIGFFRYIEFADVLALGALILIFRLLFALIFFLFKAGKKVQDVSTVITTASELQALTELERQGTPSPPSAPPTAPPTERAVKCSGCAATILIKPGAPGRCEYCGSFVEAP